ncbi:hypothetical protein [Taibaiella lutea]|nr:hypothetical protein [Taibaiella lutea]
MNKQLLQEYLLFLLSADKAAIIIQHSDSKTIIAIVTEMTLAIKYLPAYFALPVLEKLISVAAINDEAAQMVASKITGIKKEQKWQKAYPWLIVLITICILIAMYLFSKK